MARMTCQKCGAQWETLSTPAMLRFRPKIDPSGLTSPAQILAAAQEITECPKCPIPALDEAMKRGDRREDDA
jgi:hypothetical protein